MGPQETLIVPVIYIISVVTTLIEIVPIVRAVVATDVGAIVTAE